MPKKTDKAPAQVPAPVDYRAKAKAVVAQYQAKFQMAVDQVKALVISGQASMDKAGEYKNEAVMLVKLLEEKRDELVRPLNEEVKFINGLFKPFTTGLENAKDELARKMKAYLAECERRRQEEEAKAREEARQKELELKRATLAQAFPVAITGLNWNKELAPEETLAEAYVDMAMLCLGKNMVVPEPRAWAKSYLYDKEVPYIDELELAPEETPAPEVVQAQAQVMSAGEIVVPPIPQAPEVAKPGGTYLRYNWRFRYVDEKGQPSPVPVLSLIPLEFHQVNEQMLGALARTSKGMAVVPGVQFYKE